MKKRYCRKIIFSILVIYMMTVSSAFALIKGPKNIDSSININTTSLLSNPKDKKSSQNQDNINLGNNQGKNPGKLLPSLKPATKVVAFDQLGEPAKGEEIAVITTSLKNGVVKIRLFPQFAPKTVELFKERVNSGFYNGLSINKIIPNSMMQCGLNQQTNPSNMNLVNESSLDEPSSEVRNYRGAIATIGKDGSLDQFIIVQADSSGIVKDTLGYIENNSSSFPKDVINKYKKLGGAPFLDFQNIVFGQVIQSQGQGMKTIDKIAKVNIDENNKPKNEIKIIKIEIQNY